MNDKLIMIQPSDFRWYELDNLPNEEWKDIPSYVGLYQVSNYGRVKSLKRNIILSPTKSKASKYRYNVTLCKNGTRKVVKCHRLVAQVFIPNPQKLPEVNHINPVTPNFCDNRSTKLEWATHKDNMTWRVKCGNQPKNTFIKNGTSVNNKRVIQLTKDNIFVQVFPSLKIAMKETGIDETGISRVCNNNAKTAGGYKFMFEEEYYERLGCFKK